MDEYEEEYHRKIHERLLKNRHYYMFRAGYSKKNYIGYLKGSIFEFGCGMGQNIYLAKDHAVGFDISKFAVNECKKRGINAVNRLDKIKNKDGCLMVHVLEHIEEPVECLMVIRSKLNNNSRIVIVLPVYRRNKPETHDYGMDKSQHLYYWNFAAINALLKRAGFNVILNRFNYARGFSFFYTMPYWLAFALTKMLGIITNTKEMIIVAENSGENSIP